MGWGSVEGFHAELKLCLSIPLQASAFSLDLPGNQITMSRQFSVVLRGSRGQHQGEGEEPTEAYRCQAECMVLLPYLQFQAGSGPLSRLKGT